MSVPTIKAAALDAPTLRHAFFTRRGGVSGGIYRALNVGFGSRDKREHVAENRQRAMAALGIDPPSLTTLHQVHGIAVHVVDDGPAPTRPPKADALVTRRPGRALGILTADCAPVLLADAEAGVVGAAHAGWRGALAGVVEAAVVAMEREGARRSRICGALGPCIGQASYQVGPEFPGPFLAADPANARFFQDDAEQGRFRFDLRGFVLSRLAALGLAEVEDIRHDTCAETDMFFSYRRSVLEGEPDYGRCLSTIALAG